MSDARPTLTGLNLVAKDIDATIAFYRRLGLEIPEEVVWKTNSGGHHVALSLPNGFDFDLDSEKLAQVYNAAWRGAEPPSARAVIGFKVETREAVDELYATLTGEGHLGLQPPWDAFWGARHAIVEDPDGNHVGIMSPSDPERRSAPPAI